MTGRLVDPSMNQLPSCVIDHKLFQLFHLVIYICTKTN